jgi:uncharacterized membrane protein YjfL (UPF0719 family)
MDLGFSIIIFLLQIFIGILFAILSIYLGLRFYDKMTKGIDEIKELKKGNVAVAILVATVIYLVSLVVAGAISGISDLSIFKPETIANLLGL